MRAGPSDVCVCAHVHGCARTSIKWPGVVEGVVAALPKPAANHATPNARSNVRAQTETRTPVHVYGRGWPRKDRDGGDFGAEYPGNSNLPGGYITRKRGGRRPVVFMHADLWPAVEANNKE